MEEWLYYKVLFVMTTVAFLRKMSAAVVFKHEFNWPRTRDASADTDNMTSQRRAASSGFFSNEGLDAQLFISYFKNNLQSSFIKCIFIRKRLRGGV